MMREKSALGLKKRRREAKKNVGGPSRRETKIARLRSEKKRLRAGWLQENENEEEGVRDLYEQLQEDHRKIVRDQRRVDRKKEVRKTRKKFLLGPPMVFRGMRD